MNEQVKIEGLNKLFEAAKDNTYKMYGIDKMLEYAAANGKADREKFIEFLDKSKIANNLLIQHTKEIKEYFLDTIFSNRNFSRLWVTLTLKNRLDYHRIKDSVDNPEYELLRNWCDTFEETELSYASKNYNEQHVKIIQNPKYHRFDFFKAKYTNEYTEKTYWKDCPVNMKPEIDAKGFPIHILKDDNFIHYIDFSNYVRKDDKSHKFGESITTIIEKDFPSHMVYHYFDKKCLRIK